MTDMRVLLQTETGRIQIEIFDEQAPVTAGYFRGLIDWGDYDDATFYRSSTLDIADGPRLIQGGLLGEAIAKAARGVAPEFLEVVENASQTGLRHRKGTVSLARDLVDTGFVLESFLF